MFNKILTYGGALGFVLILLFGRDVISYVTTTGDQVSEAVRSKIPIDFEIERAKNMIEDLTPQIRNSMVAIAREEIAIENLAGQVRQLEADHADAKSRLTNLQSQLETDREEFQLGTTTYTAIEFTKYTETRFERFKTQSETLTSLRNTLDARRQGLASASKQLNELVSVKDQLLVEIESLEAREQMNAVARANIEMSMASLDESKLTRTRELIREIETRIRVEERLTATEQHFMEGVSPVVDVVQSNNDHAESRRHDVAEKISNYFAVVDVESETNQILDNSSLGTDFATVASADASVGDQVSSSPN